MLTSSNPLQTVTVLIQGILLIMSLVLVVVFLKDLVDLGRRAIERARRRRAYRERFNVLLSLGTIWKPK